MAFGISAATWGMVGAGAGLMGAGMGAMGSMGSGDAAAAAARAQAEADMFNAKIAGENAEIAKSQGIAEKGQIERNASRTLGSMIAEYGASGVETDTGSPMDVLGDSVRMAVLDSLTSQYNTALKIRDYKNQQQLDLMAAAAGVQAAQASSTAGMIGAAGSLIGGIGSAASGLSNVAAYNAAATPVKTN